MKGLLQRVRGARVEVAGEVIGSIDQGLLVLVAVEPEDSREQADKLLHKLLNYRVFSDEQGKMNLSLKDVGGGLLLVSQFTLAADTRNGMRPSFSTAAPPAARRHRPKRPAPEADRTCHNETSMIRRRHCGGDCKWMRRRPHRAETRAAACPTLPFRAI